MTCQAIANGFQCEKDKSITFTSPYDSSNPLTTHNWTIDSIPVSTAVQFAQIYPVTGSHTIVHTGTNGCGAGCTETVALQIVDVIQPPTTPAPAATSSALPIIGSLFFLGLIGVVMTRK